MVFIQRNTLCYTFEIKALLKLYILKSILLLSTLNDLLVIQITVISPVFLSSFLKALIVHDCQVTLCVIAVRLQQNSQWIGKSQT